jgi:tetratricopeptide (TPR) repeat protein
MLECPDRDALERLLLGDLPAEETEAVESHVAACPRCLEVLRSLKTEDVLIKAVRAVGHEGGAMEHAEPTAIASLCRLPRTEDSTTSTSPRNSTAAVSRLLAPPGEPDELGRFGPYGILRSLGSGGMGVVFAARRAHPSRVVALKMILGGLHDGQRRARFQSETEIIARLQHPHIVQVFEAGEHDGQAYYTMEYLDGGSLAQRLAAAPLEPRAAAQLALALARAVHFAHERGFVHRDLKPANVLLAADGTPKVADFGLAKQVGTEPGDPEAAFRTASGAILGTPGYMAPEQAEGKRDIGPLVDVYALGAILYECLTGRPPFKAATVLETLDQVRSQEPVPISRLQPKVPRDLQTICLKCLRKEPVRRYASAAALAEDLGRFLRGEPIRARPVSAAERLWKWARQKPALAALLAVSAVSLAALIAGGLVYNARLRAALDETQQQRSRADAGYREARETLEQMLARLERQPVGAVPQLKELQRRLREDALAFYQKSLDRADSADAKLRLDTAEACRRAADLQESLGRPEEAVKNYQRVIDLVEGLPGESRDAPDNQVLLAGTHHNLAMHALGLRRWDEAERHLEIALGIDERLARDRPDDPRGRGGVAETEHTFGVICQLTDRRAAAEAHYARAISLRADLVRANPQDEDSQAKLAEDYLNLGLILQGSGRRTEAARAYEKADGLLRRRVERDPLRGDYKLSLAGVDVNWGSLLRDKGQVLPALAKHTEAAKLADAVLGQEPRRSDARARAYQAHGTRAQTAQRLGLWAEAVKDWDRVVELDDAPDRWKRRVDRALALARAGEHARAAAEADVLAADPAVSTGGLVNLAVAYAVAVEAARKDGRLPSSERAALAERYGPRAVALLNQLRTRNYFQDMAHVLALFVDTDLQPLRSRDDFRKLLADVTKRREK